MPKLPILRDKEVVKILEKKGFVFHRQKGSHMIFKKNGYPAIIVPMHNRELKRGLLGKIMKDADIDVSEL